MLIGLWADKWEHYAAAETFLMMPLMLLSGTFYSIEVLPEIGRDIIAGNPMFYLIDGVRAGLIGHAESDLAVGGLFLLLLCLGLGMLLWRLLERGYKIRF
jgi:ABC-2 type transport system permease protein